MSSAARTLRTAMHLRPAQVWHRLGRKVGGLLPRRPLVCPASPVVSSSLTLPPDMPEAGAPEGDAEHWLSQMEQGTFTHLGQTQQLATDEQMDWRLGPVSQDRLWTVTLHYHAWAERLAELVARDDQLSDRADAVLRRYLADWLDHCDLEQEGAEQLAWNAYAIATRIGHWARLWHRLGERGRQPWGDGFQQRFLKSLWKQGAFLARNIEWDLRANHLMRDAVGLAWAGRFFEGDEPQRWLAAATQLALDQAAEQVLPDGGHFERSPMYHLHIMEDLATLARLIQDPAVVQQLRETWQRMAMFVAWARHPDGHIPLLNDAAFNGCPSPSDALKQAPARNGGGEWGGRHFADFGLFIHHSPAWSVFFDVGPVGVDYQPGHAHADTLTFECSFQGKRLIVDPGTFAYDHDHRRAYDRSTAAHNTVCIDGENSSEVWHIFRVGRRARPVNVAVDGEADCFHVAASHDGYRHLPGRPMHRREMQLDADRRLKIIDHVTGQGEHHMQGSLLIAPDWHVRSVGDGQWRLQNESASVTLRMQSDQPLIFSDESAAYHPAFGEEQLTRRLTWQYHGHPPLQVQTLLEGDVR